MASTSIRESINRGLHPQQSGCPSLLPSYPPTSTPYFYLPTCSPPCSRSLSLHPRAVHSYLPPSIHTDAHACANTHTRGLPGIEVGTSCQPPCSSVCLVGRQGQNATHLVSRNTRGTLGQEEALDTAAASLAPAYPPTGSTNPLTANC